MLNDRCKWCSCNVRKKVTNVPPRYCWDGVRDVQRATFMVAKIEMSVPPDVATESTFIHSPVPVSKVTLVLLGKHEVKVFFMNQPQ